ncbi:unnamed protein product, partial [Pylaiella littoralis]
VEGPGLGCRRRRCSCWLHVTAKVVKAAKTYIHRSTCQVRRPRRTRRYPPTKPTRCCWHPRRRG